MIYRYCLVWIFNAYYDPSYLLFSCTSTKSCSNQGSGISNRGFSLNLNQCVIFSQSNFTLKLKFSGLYTVIDIYSLNQWMGKGFGSMRIILKPQKRRQCMRPALQNLGILNPNLFIKSHVLLRLKLPGTSLVVQWLRLHAPNAEGQGSIPGQGTRSHMPQLRPSTTKQVDI